MKNEKYAIVNSRHCGPSFGSTDLVISGYDAYNHSYCKKCSYEKPIRETEDKFTVEEYEVFKIM